MTTPNIIFPYLAWYQIVSVTCEEKLAGIDVAPIFSNFLHNPQKDVECVIMHPLWRVRVLFGQRAGVEYFQPSHHMLLLVSIMRQFIASDEDSFLKI